jgi:hypothetical protein
MKKGISWPDQTSEAFRDEVVNKSEKLTNPELTKAQRSSLAARIFRPFSICFWIAGCLAPRVDGFCGSIKLKPDAIP